MRDKYDPRHEARKIALCSIFCWLYSENNETECIELTKELLQTKEANIPLIEEIIKGVKQHRDEIDAIIEECAPEWPINKISKIDLVILRIAIFESLFRKETPKKVAIDEAVELAKEFGNEASSKFVNGVLGTVIEKRQG